MQVGVLTAWPMDDLEPLMHQIWDMSNEKLSIHRTTFITWLYCWSRFTASIDTILLNVTCAALPIPPIADRAMGVKDLCSILGSAVHRLFSLASHVVGMWQKSSENGYLVQRN